MKWIEPPEKDFKELENRLWNAADQLRANSNLTAAQYYQPVLGLIVLRFADTRISAQRSKLDETASTSRRAAPAIDDPHAFAGDDGRWSLRIDGVADRRHAVATATDATRNVSTASAERVVVVDTIAPAAPTVTTSFAGGPGDARPQARPTGRGAPDGVRQPDAFDDAETVVADAQGAGPCVKRAALTLTVSAPDTKPATRNVTLTRG